MASISASHVVDTKNKILDFIKNATFSVITSLVNQTEPFIIIKTGSNNDRSTYFTYYLSKQPEKFALYMKTLSIIQYYIESDRYATKRDVYYQFKHIYKTQLDLDNALNDIARTIDVPRTSLNIISSAKGLVVGNLQIQLNDGFVIDYQSSRFGSLIPNQVDQIVHMRTSAKFVLIVEKDATFQRLVDDSFPLKYNAILGKGVPDISTRQMIHMMGKTLDLRFFCLTDANPYGLQIMSIYKYGSETLDYDKSNLSMPRLEWIGLKVTDLDYFDLKSNGNLKMELSKSDKQTAVCLISKLNNLFEFELVNQLEFMLANNCKAELQYLQHISLNFLCETYLRAKLDKRLLESHVYYE